MMVRRVRILTLRQEVEGYLLVLVFFFLVGVA